MVEYTDYSPAAEREETQLADDTLGGEEPAFDAALVDSRPLGDWQVNASAAVVRLDCPMIKPDTEGAHARAAAVVCRRDQGGEGASG